ncbi:hypothetical protein G7Y89_g8218 [Cudoniella acicularis]|uniref:NACHT domain-containing protein n=1 Tax=Cudoniella acicularis TaxID=354080 RepID=A0A8H4RH20_9HELO|nr:hypothetical protein G7Y89_g8218 [Cudoniella acicularis]
MSNSLVDAAMAHPPRTHEDYQIGIICALATEIAAIEVMLDETHPKLRMITGDENKYTLGRIGAHNVVIACLPAGLIGNGPAAIVANNMQRSFPVKFGLMVGVGGGVWSKKDDIRLGDVVVSEPTGAHGGVVQWDFGKKGKGGRFQRTGSLNKPPLVLLHALQALRTLDLNEGINIKGSLTLMVQNTPRMGDTYRYQGVDHDQLFEAFYDHKGDEACDACDPKFILQRPDRKNSTPMIHYGNIASGNEVMKHGTTRDKIAKKEGVICFEMEAAGLMDNFPCLVIRGICDYADSHKNKIWQPYAAATAAAVARALLGLIDKQEAIRTPLEVSQISDLINDMSESIRIKEQSKIMHWLSSANFWGKQVDLLNRAQRGTGRWIFEDKKFISWLTGHPRLLWCQGDAGAGKTILLAIIIDHLSSTMKSKDIGIAWLYIDYREHDLQTMETLFTNLLVQLFKQRGEISKSMMKSLGFNWEGAKPTPAEYKSWLQEEIQKFDRTIVIIDALDELRNKELCKQFINELQSLSRPVHLLVTSRSGVELPFLLDDSIEIEIQPRKDDVILYIECRLRNSQQLWNHIIADPSLKELIIEMLTKANDRMFLKAELILNVLEHLETAKEVKEALNSLPPTYDGCYEFTLRQIEMKDTVQRNLAFKILAWLSHALGGLTVNALQEALSVQAGDEKVDEKKQIPVDNLISVCSGLAITETVEGTQNIRLLHETASRYLKNIRSASFPPGHEIILKACLAYLSLPEFSELCFFKTKVDERASKHPFYEYAAKYWPDHAILGNLQSTFRNSIVDFLESSQRHSADEFLSSGRPSAWGCDSGTPWTDWNKLSINRRDTPLHAAAAYGLRATVRYLIKKNGYEKDRRNNFGETALHRAAQVGMTGTMEELIAHGADLNAKVRHHYLNEATPLILAAICLQIESVRVLLNHGVDVNSFDPIFRTFPLHLAASMDTKLTRLLLDRGALVDFPGKSPCYPETWPMTSLHFAVFNAHAFQGALNRANLLLDRGANINAQSSSGNTPLHMAILAGHQDLAHLLLQKGANISLQNKNGKSVVQLARERGHLHWIEEGVSEEIFQKLLTGSPLHRAIWSKNHSLVHELLETGNDIAEEDQERVTPWEYCIRRSDVELAKILVDHMDKHKSFDHVGNAAFETALNNMTAFDYTDQQSWEKTVQICDLLLPFRRMFDPNLEFAKIESPICEYKKTFLIWAAGLGRISQVEFFLSCGSDVNAADTFGNTGMHYAVGNKDFAVVKLLIKMNLKLKNRDGITPLVTAQKTGNIEIREYLEAELSRQSRQN